MSLKETLPEIDESKLKGSSENPFISASEDGDKIFKFCLCGGCKEVKQCTPSNDYYKKEDDDSLLCECCYQESIEAEYGPMRYADEYGERLLKRSEQ